MFFIKYSHLESSISMKQQCMVLETGIAGQKMQVHAPLDVYFCTNPLYMCFSIMLIKNDDGAGTFEGLISVHILYTCALI